MDEGLCHRFVHQFFHNINLLFTDGGGGGGGGGGKHLPSMLLMNWMLLQAKPDSFREFFIIGTLIGRLFIGRFIDSIGRQENVIHRFDLFHFDNTSLFRGSWNRLPAC